MKKVKVCLVGIGKLGKALMEHWNKTNISIGVYHPSLTKTEDFVQHYQNSYLLTPSKFNEIDIFILALPAKEIIPFISNEIIKMQPVSSINIVNMATAIHTNEIKNNFPSLNVFGVKYMGQWRDLLENGNGLFITETALPKQIEELFLPLGQVKIDREDHLIKVNKLATYHALKTAVAIENEMSKNQYSTEYTKRALTSIAPEVIRAYSNGTLGHFAKEILKEIKSEKE
ncbi:NAD(P)-binding domain-containing protein [Bacillus sp. EB106-08-02-XG196]|uniref:NAD(P)-binding domain-containing protein n=1 Tax=Bacillus sp. EB106-08-02-XG196 TaxID=2737049 RepID=UPI00211B2CB9|nr:NAD(P)-binding domain-containing protein [Bacillus sp. EB106-08-02-XG196]